MHKNYFVFDVDGVLADTTQYHDLSLRMAALDYGVVLEEHVCDGSLTSLSKLERAGVPTAMAHDIYEKKKELFALSMHNLAEDDNLIELFRGIKNAGVYIGICSNSNVESCGLVLLRLGITKYVDVLVTGSDVVKGKPAPDIYRRVLEMLQTVPESVVVFEDSDEGITAATSAGIYNVVRCTTKSIYEEVAKWL